MNGTMIFTIVAVGFIISGLINFVQDLEDDTAYNSSTSGYVANHKKSEVYGHNIYGDKSLILTGLAEVEKQNIWKSSFLRDKMLALFPNFTDMKELIENCLIDDGLFKKELLEKLVTLEKRYIGGLETKQSVEISLSSF